MVFVDVVTVEVEAFALRMLVHMAFYHRAR
jgi:hypothetical protein